MKKALWRPSAAHTWSFTKMLNTLNIFKHFHGRFPHLHNFLIADANFKSSTLRTSGLVLLHLIKLDLSGGPTCEIQTVSNSHIAKGLSERPQVQCCNCNTNSDLVVGLDFKDAETGLKC